MLYQLSYVRVRADSSRARRPALGSRSCDLFPPEPAPLPRYSILTDIGPKVSMASEHGPERNCTTSRARSSRTARGSSPPTRARARSRSGSTRSAIENDRGAPAGVPRPALHDAGRRGVHQRRDPLRRDDPPERARRHAVPEAARVEGHHPRDQGRQGREAACARRGRDDHRGPRRPPRALRRVLRASARASRSGARRTRSRDELPSEYCIWTNAHALARYAALCQEAGIVPIVEPEILQDGTHTIERSYHVACTVLGALYTELADQRVDLEGTLLKPNMVLSGYEASDRAGIDEVADWTLKCFYKHVPAAVPGIVFLSGGQSDEDSTAHLNAMNARGPAPVEDLVLVRPRTAGSRAEGVAGQARPGRGGAACVLPPRQAEQRGADRHVRAGDGTRDRERLRHERGAARRPSSL